MTIFGDMTKRRKRLDDEQLSDAYADLAASVLGKRFRAGMDADEMALANDAIASILHWYGAKEAEVPDDLTDFNDRLAFLLRPTGIMHRDVRLTEGWYKDAVGAMLGRLEDNTPVALIPRAFSGYYYLDPNTEKRVVLNRRTAKGIQPDAICFYRPFPLRSLKTTDLGAFIASSLRLSDYAFALVATMAVTLIGLLPAQLNQLLFSVVIPSNSKSLILPMAMLLVSITLSQGLINSCKALVMSRLTTKLSVQVEAATMGRILSLEPDFFKHYPAGDLASRTVKMNNLVQAIIDLVLSSGLTSLFSLVYIFQIMAFAPGLVVPALLVIVADVAVTTLSAYLQMSYNKRELNAGAKVSGITTSLLQGIQKIKLAGAERRAFAQWGKAYAEQTRSSFDKPLFLKVSGTLSTVIGLLGTIVIYYFAAATNVSVANFMAFNTAYGMVVGAVKTLSATGTAIASIRPTMEHIEPILKAVPEVSESKRAITRVSGSISLVNVTFSYGEDLPPSSTASPSRSRPASTSPSRDARAAGSPPSCGFCSASRSPLEGPSTTTASTRRPSTCARFAGTSASCSRTASSSRATSSRTSPSAHPGSRWTRPGTRPRRPASPRTSAPCPWACTRSSPRAGEASPGGRSSVSSSPARSPRSPRCSSSTRPRALSTTSRRSTSRSRWRPSARPASPSRTGSRRSASATGSSCSRAGASPRTAPTTSSSP